MNLNRHPHPSIVQKPNVCSRDRVPRVQRGTPRSTKLLIYSALIRIPFPPIVPIYTGKRMMRVCVIPCLTQIYNLSVRPPSQIFPPYASTLGCPDPLLHP